MINQKDFRKLFLIALVVAVFYIAAGFLFFPGDVIKGPLNYLSGVYLLLLESLANIIFGYVKPAVSFVSHELLKRGELIYSVPSGVLLKKWVLGLIVLIWITPAKTDQKILFSAILLVTHFVFIFLDLVLLGLLTGITDDTGSLTAMSRTPGVVAMTSIFWIWTSKYKNILIDRLHSFGINKNFLYSKYPDLIVIMFIFAVVGNLVTGYFQFGHWIQFLFTSAERILALIGYEALYDNNYLLGVNANLYMEKGCLAIRTMMLFAAIVWLTGNRLKTKTLYIIAGIIFLNLVNIVRFVILFIHVQKHGDYVLSIDVHDFYTIVVYVVIFFMWVLWFEKFSDTRIKN